MKRANFLLLASTLCICFLLSGCATVIEQIQQTTGSKIEKVDQIATKTTEEDKEEKTAPKKRKKDLPKSPAPHTELKQILEDEGRGEYAGENYDKSKVTLALDQMPKGLSEDKAYAYLLGLVGENYREDVSMFNAMEEPNYEPKLNAWKANQQLAPQQNQPTSSQPKSDTKTGVAAQPSIVKKANIVVMLDASRSMKIDNNGSSKMDWAEEAIRQFATNLPKENTSFSLRVYGHQNKDQIENKDDACVSTEKLYSAEQVDPNKLGEMFKAIQPTGWTPLAHAIQSSYNDQFKADLATLENMVIIIGDGSETCGGDPIAVAEKLHQSDRRSNIHVIGLDVGVNTEATLRKVADVTGGNYQTVRSNDELKQTLANYVDSLKQLNEPWQVRALSGIIQSYRYDHKRLDGHYEAMMKKSDEEYRHLDEANDYIKKKGKIDGATWAEIGTWIDSRWKELGKYSDQRREKISEALDAEWKLRFSELENAWREAGGKPEEFETHKNEYLKEQLEFQIHKSIERIGKARVQVETSQ